MRLSFSSEPFGLALTLIKLLDQGLVMFGVCVLFKSNFKPTFILAKDSLADFLGWKKTFLRINRLLNNLCGGSSAVCFEWNWLPINLSRKFWLFSLPFVKKIMFILMDLTQPALHFGHASCISALQIGKRTRNKTTCVDVICTLLSIETNFICLSLYLKTTIVQMTICALLHQTTGILNCFWTTHFLTGNNSALY
jgi:hypothetical protein